MKEKERLEFIHKETPVKVISYNMGLNRRDRRKGMKGGLLRNTPYVNRERNK